MINAGRARPCRQFSLNVTETGVESCIAASGQFRYVYAITLRRGTSSVWSVAFRISASFEHFAIAEAGAVVYVCLFHLRIHLR